MLRVCVVIASRCLIQLRLRVALAPQDVTAVRGIEFEDFMLKRELLMGIFEKVRCPLYVLVLLVVFVEGLLFHLFRPLFVHSFNSRLALAGL